MASVTVDDVRDVINVSSSEISDSKIAKMVKRAEVTLELETDKEIDYSNCSDAEKEFIRFSPSSMRFVILLVELLSD